MAVAVYFSSLCAISLVQEVNFRTMASEYVVVLLVFLLLSRAVATGLPELSTIIKLRPLVKQQVSKPRAKTFTETFRGALRMPSNVATVQVMVDGYRIQDVISATMGAKMSGVVSNMGFVGRYKTTAEGAYLKINYEKITSMTKTRFDGLFNGMPMVMMSTNTP